MDHSRECATITVLMLLYVANTILMYVSLKGNNWVTYEGGNSGLWNNCNDTPAVHNDTTTNSTDEENCDYIYMSDASVMLHIVRAFFIIGFICWCLGMIQRYLTWQHRGTKVDEEVILFAFCCSVCVFIAAILFSAFVRKDYEEDSAKYSNTHVGVDHSLSFVGASLATLLVILSIRHHKMLNSTTSLSSCAKRFPCCHPGSRLIACCGKTDTQPHATSQPASRHHSSVTEPSGSTTLDMSVISTDNSDNNSSSRSSQRHSGLQRSLVLLGAVLNVRRAVSHSEQHSGRDRAHSVDESEMTDNVGGDVSVVPSSGISEWSSGRSGGESNGRDRHRPPIDVMALPPAYDDVIGDSSAQDNNGTNLPPSYDEVIGNRELILTPPPAYEESTG